MKKRLVLRSETLALKFKEEYLKLKKRDNDYIISLRYISELYIFEGISVSLRTCRKIAKFVPVYIIDARGRIVARLCRETRDEET